MGLTDLPAQLIADTIRIWRRRLIVGAIVGACGLAAVIEGITAVRLALEAGVGPVFARLILVAIFGLVIGAAVVWLQRRERGPAKSEAKSEAKTERAFGSSERVATIAEAIDLGYAMGREFWHRKPADPAPADQSAAAANGAAPGAGVYPDAAPPRDRQ